MLRGLKTKWKQVIAWHVCPKNNDADRLYQFFQELLIKVEGIGLKVRGILSDMGPKNLALWRHYGIKVNRITASHFIDHPIRKEEKLYFMADVPHLLKNIKSMFITHEITVSPTSSRAPCLKLTILIIFQFLIELEPLVMIYINSHII